MASPTDISGLVSWFKAEYGTNTTTDGAAISSWTPYAGSVTNNLTATSPNQPVYDAVKNAVVTEVGPTGPNQFLVPSGITLSTQSYSVFFILEATTVRDSLQNSSATAANLLMTSTSDALDLYIGNGLLGTSLGGIQAASSYGGGGDSIAVTPAGNRVLIGFTGSAGSSTGYVDVLSASTYPLASGMATVNAFGGTPNNISGSNPSGYAGQFTIKDIIVYNTVVTSTQVSTTLAPYAYTRGVTPFTSFNGNIVYAGDEITQGMGATLNRGWVQDLTLPSTWIQNISAQYGMTAATIQNQEFESLLLATGPNVLVVWCGTWDITNGTTAATTYSYLTSYINDLQGDGFKVCVVTPLPWGYGTAPTGAYASLRTLILANTAGANAVVDPIASTALQNGWASSSASPSYSYDGMHPNNAGYALIASLIQPTLQAMIPAVASIAGSGTLTGEACSKSPMAGSSTLAGVATSQGTIAGQSSLAGEACSKSPMAGSSTLAGVATSQGTIAGQSSLSGLAMSQATIAGFGTLFTLASDLFTSSASFQGVATLVGVTQSETSIAGIGNCTGVSTGYSLNGELIAYWTANATLQSFIPVSQLYLCLVPEDMVFPYAVVVPTTALPVFTTGRSYVQYYNFQISIYDTNPDNVDYLCAMVAWQFDFRQISPWTMACVRTSGPIVRADPTTQERVYVGTLEYKLNENKTMPV